MGTVFFIALLVVGFAGVSACTAESPLTSPLVFLGAGVLLWVLDLIPVGSLDGVLHLVAEMTLVVLLFTEAAQIDVRALRRGSGLALRLLAIGLPLTILLGGAVGTLVLPAFGWTQALLLGAILAPTDAALGQAVVTSVRVPERIRRTLNVESGLNDGVVFPAIMVICAFAAPAIHSRENWSAYVALQLTLGPLAGMTVGLLGGRFIVLGTRRGWMNDGYRQISALALAIAAFSGAELIGGNGIIAAFVAGLALGNTAHEVRGCLLEFAEAQGQLLMLIAFLLIGALLVGPAFVFAGAATFVYAILSLTVVRAFPVALSLWGTGLRTPSLLFLGWFGPRGLASIVFALFAVHQGVPAGGPLLNTVVITVVLSTLLHGISAAPLAAMYGRFAGRVRSANPNSSECRPVSGAEQSTAERSGRLHSLREFWISFAGRMGVPLVFAPLFAGFLDMQFGLLHVVVCLCGVALAFLDRYTECARDV